MTEQRLTDERKRFEAYIIKRQRDAGFGARLSDAEMLNGWESEWATWQAAILSADRGQPPVAIGTVAEEHGHWPNERETYRTVEWLCREDDAPPVGTKLYAAAPSTPLTWEQAVRSTITDPATRDRILSVPSNATAEEARAILAAPSTPQPAPDFLREFVNICEVCDINETMDDDGYGWKALYLRAKAALATPQPDTVQVPQWQPIETAPRGGRELMLLLTPSKFPQVCYSHTWWQSGFSVECKPTHWMPIPKPPESKE